VQRLSSTKIPQTIDTKIILFLYYAKKLNHQNVFLGGTFLNTTIIHIRIMKANFKISNVDREKKNDENSEKPKEASRSEFEDFIVKSGAKGSFMIYRSNKKDDELGLNRL